MAESGDYERVALVKSEVFVYRIPPLGTNRGYRAADWKLDAPEWTGRLRCVSLGPKLEIRLEDKTSGSPRGVYFGPPKSKYSKFLKLTAETMWELFAKCPVDRYPGPAVEAVLDSSRYFVIKLVNDNGQSAFIGIGFADRGDSFDLNVALQDHFKYVEQEKKSAEEAATEASRPKLDMAFKEGQTITINLGNKKDGSASARSRPKAGGGAGGPVPLLPPPPSGSSGRVPAKPGAPLPAPPSALNLPAQAKPDLADEFGSLSTGPSPSAPPPSATGALADLVLGHTTFGNF